MWYIIITLWVLGAYGILLTISSAYTGRPDWTEDVDVLSVTAIFVWPLTVVAILLLSVYDTLTSNQWKL